MLALGSRGGTAPLRISRDPAPTHPTHAQVGNHDHDPEQG